MKIKKGVQLAGLDKRMRVPLIAAELAYKDLGYEMTITSGLEGTHSAGSLHYYGLAVDIRTGDLEEEDHVYKIVEKIKQRLMEWRIDDIHFVVHPTHLHMQFSKENII